MKRSLSLLGSTVAAAATGGVASSTHKFEQMLNGGGGGHGHAGNRYEHTGTLLGASSSKPILTRGGGKPAFDHHPPADVHGYSKPINSHRAAAANNGAGGSGGGGPGGGSGAGQMRHAVIRRHQSMYIHPRTTTEIAPATFGVGGGGTANVIPPYKLHDVGGGKSEVRPIVTVKRSKTTAASLHYKATSIQALHKNTFGSGVNAGGNGPSNKYASRQRDYNHNTIPHPIRRKPSNAYNATEELCEFQVRIIAP